MKKCKRCSYKKTAHKIYYDESGREQKVIGITYLSCIRCGNKKPRSEHSFKHDLFDIPENISPIVDLTKIIHEHEKHKTEDSTYYSNATFDKEECVEIDKIIKWHCSFCNKHFEEVVEHYTANNPCEEMTRETEKYRLQKAKHEEDVKLRNAHKDGSFICPKTGKPFHTADKGWFNDRPFMSQEVIDIRCSECDTRLEYSYDDGRVSKTGFWWK